MTAVRHRAEGALHAEPRRVDRRRVAALLAACSVLGVGAGITTLASWHQTLSVGSGSGTPITTSKFCVEESFDSGTTWTAGLVGSAGTALTFTSSALALSPGDQLFSYVQFRTCQTSTRAGLLSLTGVTGATGALAPYLTYGVLGGVTSSAGCTASAFASASTSNLLAPATTALTSSGAPTTQAIPLPVGLNGAGASVGVCIEVALPSAPVAVQGQSASPTWTFDAQSS